MWGQECGINASSLNNMERNKITEGNFINEKNIHRGKDWTGQEANNLLIGLMNWDSGDLNSNHSSVTSCVTSDKLCHFPGSRYAYFLNGGGAGKKTGVAWLGLLRWLFQCLLQPQTSRIQPGILSQFNLSFPGFCFCWRVGMWKALWGITQGLCPQDVYYLTVATGVTQRTLSQCILWLGPEDRQEQMPWELRDHCQLGDRKWLAGGGHWHLIGDSGWGWVWKLVGLGQAEMMERTFFM